MAESSGSVYKGKDKVTGSETEAESPAVITTGLAKIDDLIVAGTKAYGLKQYEEATEKFGKACEQYVIAKGKDHPYLLFYYGRSLFQVAVSSSDVLGGSKSTDAPENDMIANKSIKDAAESKATATTSTTSKENIGLFQFTGDVEDEEEEESEDEEPEADDSDFQTAWEVLDLSRTMFERQIKAIPEEAAAQAESVKKTVADIYDILGEISLESENFNQALRDLQSSLDLKEKLYPSYSTFISEAYFKLSLALEFIPEDPKARANAAEYVQKSIDSLQERSEKIGESDPELLESLQTRLQELKSAPTTQTSANDLMGQSATDLRERITKALTGAQDITGLVKRKRPAQSSEGGESSRSRESNDSKKQKPSPGLK
ncbi:uncharacterized protein V1516DRAFT_345136 [Lipomyces oligophaga]|uniref:uncharacterized protein n=1 Tax=Lipomyces oligophaga TaxID=45792 RepID=UPI0034CDDFE1